MAERTVTRKLGLLLGFAALLAGALLPVAWAEQAPTSRQTPSNWGTVVGAPAEFNTLMALRGRAREDKVNADAAYWEPILRSGIEEARRTGQTGLVAEALIALGRARWRLKDAAGAEAALRESIALFRSLGQSDPVFDPMLALGVILFAQYRLDEVLQLNQEMLALAQGNPRREANALTNIGIVERRMGNPAAAMQAFERALALRRTLHDDLPELLPSSIQQLAGVHSDRGEYLRALELMQEATQLRLKIGGEAAAQAELALARLHQRADNPARAVVHWRAGLAGLGPAVDPRGRANAYCEYANSLHAAGDTEAAAKTLAEAREFARGIPESETECARTEAAAALRDGEASRALELVQAQRQVHTASGSVGDWLEAATLESEALLQLKQANRALPLIDEALATAQRVVRMQERIPLLRLRAEALHLLGRDAQAYAARLEYETADAQARGAATTEQLALFLEAQAREREAARAQQEAQGREIAELAAQAERERALRAALIAALALALAAVLWLRARELRRRQQALAARHDALSAAHQQLEQESEVLAIEAGTDALTGTRSRRAIVQHLRATLAQADSQCCAVLFDLDHFKRINDVYGHPGGDAALRHASALLTREIGAHGSLGRYGGEEFLLVLSRAAVGEAVALVEHCLQTLANSPLILAQGELRITSSAGCACARPGEDSESLIARADQALYRAKAEGRNRLVLAD